MHEISIITENGERFAKVPLKDYLEMSEELEDARDSLIVAKASRDPRDYIPMEVAARIWDGVDPVRAWREHRGLTQEALASAIGLTRAFLSQIETGKREMSVSTLQKLATAFNTDPSFLLKEDYVP